MVSEQLTLGDLDFSRFFNHFLRKTTSNSSISEIMCKSETTVKDPNKTTNVGLVNVSDNSKTFVGIGEILSGITLVILLWLILKLCCKRYSRSTEQHERNMEEMICRNARPTSPI